MVNINCKFDINSQVDSNALLLFFSLTAVGSSYADSHSFVTDVYKYWTAYNGKIIFYNNEINLRMSGLNSS